MEPNLDRANAWALLSAREMRDETVLPLGGILFLESLTHCLPSI